jgi:hypothetical protein
LAAAFDVQASLDDLSPTLIINAATGEKVSLGSLRSTSSSTFFLPLQHRCMLYDEKTPLYVLYDEQVAHWTELDYSGERAPVGGLERKTLLLWPAKPLDYSTHYIVVVRDVRDASGALVSPSSTFTALRDGLQSPNPDVDGKRENFEELLKVISSSCFLCLPRHAWRLVLGFVSQFFLVS